MYSKQFYDDAYYIIEYGKSQYLLEKFLKSVVVYPRLPTTKRAKPLWITPLAVIALVFV
jgi:hypothetical protein